MADFNYTVKRPNFADAHFDDVTEATLYVEELLAKGDTYEWINNNVSAAPVAAPQATPAAKATDKPAKKTKGFKCPASGYKIMQDGYELSGFSFITDDGKCSCCGKPVKMRKFGTVGLIPQHNYPQE